MTTVVFAVFAAFFGFLSLWLIEDRRQYRSENTTLRRRLAHLAGHPSSAPIPPGVSVYPGGTTPKWMEGLEPLPYMRRYADDE